MTQEPFEALEEAANALPQGMPPGSYARVTATDTQSVQFSVVNRYFGKAGYVEGEVDEFLDRVWATIARYEQNNYLLLGLANLVENVHDRQHARELAAKIREVLEWPESSTTSS